MKQRTKEWKQARLRRITASRIGDVLAAPNTKRYRTYQDEIIDAFLGVPVFDDDEKPWFRHGIEWEPEARGRYEWETGIEVEQVGVIVHPEFDFISCSPDGLVGVDGGLEIKSRKSLKAHLASVKAGIPSVSQPQVQSSIWITGRKWWDFESFYKNEETGKTLVHIFRTEPNEPYIEKIESRCLVFWDEILKKLKEIQ